MTGKSWTTEEQYEFLSLYLADFLEAQKNKQESTVFWPQVFRDWFKKFPEREALFPGLESLTEEQESTLGEALKKRHVVSKK